MSRFLNRRYRELEAYVPGEQPKDMAYVKLNTNESPYPPSKAVIEAVTRAEVDNLKLYPDPECGILRNALAEGLGTERKNIFVSNGSDDILNFAFMAFAGQGGRAVFPNITYGFYEVFARLHGVSFQTVPLQEDFSVNPSDYYDQNALVVIANPNAPTGLVLHAEQIEAIVKNNPENVVLIDEAYIDFAGESCAALTEKYDNLLVVQTFSKSRSMAGARLGFAVGHHELISDLEKIKYSTNPYSINRLSLVAGAAAVKSSDYYMEKCNQIVNTREYAKNELKQMGFFVTDSAANFLFVKKEGCSGEYIYRQLRENGILVRHFSTREIADFNRITVGTPKQMELLLRVLKTIE